MMHLNQEELNVLAQLIRLNDAKENSHFYKLATALNADTNKLIPVMWRLEEEEYVMSKGLIWRYFFITAKGRAAVQK